MSEQSSIDLIWVLLCAGQVLLMQAGFCLLEGGMSRAKNSINVAIKNLVDFCVAALSFWAVGFGLMYGASRMGLYGTSQFLFSEVRAELVTFFLFQVVFCGTATTLISGAVAERIRFRSYIILSIFVSAIVYPIFGHWAWGGAISGTKTGWLNELGFIDFAGATVVHSVGAWVALAAVLIVGPRRGRFGRGDRTISSSNLPLVVLGVLILWFGWLGFNGGSGMRFSQSVPLILLNTILSAASGGLVALALVWTRLGRPHVPAIGNGVLAGLVAVTAGCHLLNPMTAVAVGAVAAILCLASSNLLERLRIDDVIGAIPVHGVPGIWGTVSIAILTDSTQWGTGNPWYIQLGVQSLGCATAFAWAFGSSFVFLRAVDQISSLRVSARDEYIGLNIAEHDAQSELVELLTQMSRHRKGRELGRRVRVEPFTEIGRVAAAYNRVISEVEGEIIGRQEAQQQYQGIFDHAVEGIYQTYPDGSFRSVNPAMAEICGYDSPQQLRRSVTDVSRDLYASTTDRDKFLKHIAICNRVKDFQTQLRRRDGSTIWISENSRAVRDDEGNVRYFEGTIVDITQRLASENLRLQKEQAEAASSAKSEFLAGMSHEMRTPLNGIVSMLDLLAEMKLPAQQSRYLQIARRSSDTLLAIINDILDLSKIEAGRLELESVPFSLVDLVDETIEMLYHRANTKGLSLSAHLSPDIPENLVGDPVRLQQILINLISNAVKFTSRGEVSLKVFRDPVTNASVNDEQPQDRISFEIHDTGIGIPADRQARIFDPFTQADASTTRQYGGSGLGLNICHQLVTAMGGTLTVESEPGIGSVFRFSMFLTVPESGPSNDCASRRLPGTPQTNRETAKDLEGVIARSAPTLSDRTPRRDHSRVVGKTIALVAPANSETDVIEDYLERWGAECLRFDTTDTSDTESCRLSHQIQDSDLLLLDPQALASGSIHLQSALVESPQTIWLGIPSDQDESARVLMRPIRPSALLEAIESALDGLPQPHRLQTKVGQPQGDTSVFEGRRALIVDDNEINTIVAAELLDRMGLESDTVSSAELAITAAMRLPYDVILMDCEMPEMDGFQATVKLRQLHRDDMLANPKSSPLRIIAVTAQALAGQVEQCFLSGMNAHLAKPISRSTFSRTLREVFSDDGKSQPAAFAPKAPAIHWEEVVGRCGDSVDTSYQVIGMFQKQLPEQFKEIQQLVQNGKTPQARQKSHRLKGAAATLSANAIADLASEIDDELGSGQTESAKRSLKALEIEIDRCLDWIGEKLKEAAE